MKKRLDTALVDRGLITGRDKAKAVVMAGLVYVNNQKADKPGEAVGEADLIEVRGGGAKYVSRGGLKLEKALAVFPVSVKGLICMDIGASTGGFTDCMLQNGAAKVYAVDVGYGQLAWSLRTDGRVVTMERTNIRHVRRGDIADTIDFASVDVSFISLRLVLPVARELLCENGEMVCLVKPQFEAGRENVGKKGVVRDKDVHLSVVKNIAELAAENGFAVLGVDFSPVKGPEGNIEYLLHIKKSNEPVNISEDAVKRAVEASHAELEAI